MDATALAGAGVAVLTLTGRGSAGRGEVGMLAWEEQAASINKASVEAGSPLLVMRLFPEYPL